MFGKPASHNLLRVAYVVANEDLTSPLLTRQVVELLINMRAQSESPIEIKLLLFQGLTSLTRRWKRLRQLKKNMATRGVTLSIIPNLTPWPFPNLGFTKTDNGLRPNFVWNRFAVRAFAVYAFPFLAYEFLFSRRSIFHSRSYPSGFAINAIQRIFTNIKHVFDPRSDFPEENVVAGKWGADSRNFRFWKKAETALLKNANSTACISEVYADHFRKSAGCFPYFLAPNNVDTSRFSHDADSRRFLRRELGWSDADMVFVYLGGMSNGGWHRPIFYREFLLRVRERMAEAKLLMLIPSHANIITNQCFSKMEGVVIRNPAFDDVPKYLSAADAGLMFTHRRRLAVGTKLGEYLANGMPIVCNSNCLGTIGFLRSYPDAGWKMDLGLGDLDMVRDVFDPLKARGVIEERERLVMLANQIFNNGIVANTYLQSYRHLVGI